MITLHVTRANKPVGVYFELPISPAGMEYVFSRLNELSHDVGTTEILSASCPVQNIWQYIHRAKLDSADDMKKLNALAEKIGEMKPQEAQKFAGALDAESISSLDDVLRVADSLQDYTLIEDVTSDRELGRFIVVNNITLDFPRELWPYLDYAAIGAEYYADRGGAYTSGGYVLRDGPRYAMDQTKAAHMDSDPVNSPCQGGMEMR